jgi:hypothetical protein
VLARTECHTGPSSWITARAREARRHREQRRPQVLDADVAEHVLEEHRHRARRHQRYQRQRVIEQLAARSEDARDLDHLACGEP